ncbi:hypothetical protein LIER_14203 [Lithospermum erythrorhizon]|uniref:Uncharacterized protein n=1 Tax=Lithospermum erythrorhizon TaxID=34254 RepID=A0AAV3Q2W1_LITER
MCKSRMLAAALVIKAYEEEPLRLEAEILLKKDLVSDLQAKIQALRTTVPSSVNDPATTYTTAPDADPEAILADDPGETLQSRV